MQHLVVAVASAQVFGQLQRCTPPAFPHAGCAGDPALNFACALKFHCDSNEHCTAGRGIVPSLEPAAPPVGMFGLRMFREVVYFPVFIGRAQLTRSTLLKKVCTPVRSSLTPR